MVAKFYGIGFGLPKKVPKKVPKKGAQRKGTIFIDGYPSMDSLMVSINEFIDGYPSMNSLMVSINEYPWISSSLKSSSWKKTMTKQWTNHETMKKHKKQKKVMTIHFILTLEVLPKGHQDAYPMRPRPHGAQKKGPKEGPHSLMDHQWIH